MLGVPVNEWMRFFGFGFVAGALLVFVPVAPIAALGVFEMVAALTGLAVVATYARSFSPWTWKSWLAIGRRTWRWCAATARRWAERMHLSMRSDVR